MLNFCKPSSEGGRRIPSSRSGLALSSQGQHGGGSSVRSNFRLKIRGLWGSSVVRYSQTKPQIKQMPFLLSLVVFNLYFVLRILSGSYWPWSSRLWNHLLGNFRDSRIWSSQTLINMFWIFCSVNLGLFMSCNDFISFQYFVWRLGWGERWREVTNVERRVQESLVNAWLNLTCLREQ